MSKQPAEQLLPKYSGEIIGVAEQLYLTIHRNSFVDALRGDNLKLIQFETLFLYQN